LFIAKCHRERALQARATGSWVAARIPLFA
jgi:hypothetical protein